VLPIFKKKMLASTVQFSRYGRHRAPPPRPRQKGPALAEVPGPCLSTPCPVSSGPNSVLGQAS